MADLIEDPKKKKASFGDAAAAAADPGVMQIGGATRPAPMAAPAAPDIGPFVGKPGDFPVNPDGTPMQKPAPALGALAPAVVAPQDGGAAFGVPPSIGRRPAQSISAAAAPVGAVPLEQRIGWRTDAVMNGAADDASTAFKKGNYGETAGALVRGAATAIPAAVIDFGEGLAGGIVPGVKGFFSGLTGGQPTPVAQGKAGAPTATQKGNTGAGDAMMPGNDLARFAVPAQSESPLPAAPNPTAVLPSAAPSVQAVPAGAVKTQGQMNMEADLKSAEAMKAERLAAEGRAPQAVVTHSGNDWQARNNLRNLEVSASSLTAKPQDVQAYIDARKHDTSLQGGGTAADIANVAAANRNNEINSTAQVANARTAQQGQQFGASHELATQRLALDSRTQGAQAAEYGAQARLKTVQANAAEQLAALQNRYMNAKPEEQAAIAKQIQTLSGKSDKAQLHTVNQPDTMAPDGMTKLGGGQRLVVQGADGSFHEVPVGTNQQPASGVASPKSKAEYDALPKGAQYMKDGVLKTKA